MMNNDDTFISDQEEDLCPLCVEEMDISDKNFKPCPCGYQVCQFCYNNIRQNPELNGKCPACRRPYEDKNVEYKVISQEEWKLNQAKQARKEKERKQKEKEKKDAEQASRRHLAGMRVIQKNLVYVVGLNPPVSPEELHNVLRSEKYFGQYGKILKIVINKRNRTNHHNHNPGFGVYVTFAKKEDASRCIAAVDGSISDGRVLRAAHGTTKYCSSYLKGQNCPNPNCMFLHEPGEEADSYTRQDLSTRQGLKMGQSPRAAVHGLIPPPDMVPSPTIEEPVATERHVETQVSDGPILPSTASWGKTTRGSSTILSTLQSPGVDHSTLKNASSFPSLAETQQLHSNLHTPPVPKKKEKKPDGYESLDEVSKGVLSAVEDIEQTIQTFFQSPSSGYRLKENYTYRKGDTPRLFLSGFQQAPATFEENKGGDSEDMSHLVDLLLFSPGVKNYSFYRATPTQQQLQQQQQAQQAQQAQAQQAQQAQQVQQQAQQAQQQQQQAQQQQQQQQLQQQHIQQLQQIQQLQHAQQQQQQQQQQRQQQEQLLQQLQQQQQQQQYHQPQTQAQNFPQQYLMQQAQAQAQVLAHAQHDSSSNPMFPSIRESSGVSATPPPPGLFNGVTNHNAETHNTPSSELLNQLMNGEGRNSINA